jgi:V8-like Glu-specific endopeptidase
VVRGRYAITLAIAAATVLWPLAAAAPAADTTLAADVTGPSVTAPAVGALFTVSNGQLGTHFCTASVVNSPAGDLLITAAHCMAGYSSTDPAGVVFVPGYDQGSAPYGTWTVTRVFVDAAWASSANPDDDVAFLTVAPSGGTAVEDVTGGERLGTGQPAGQVVHVTGYPDASEDPVGCRNYATAYGSGQLQFDCDGYTDGTSGSPFLARAGTAGPADTVIGVIGGYEQGGDSPDVSYSAAFGPSVAALYATASAAG